jgi:membrane protease YdiL (CAAX protease family)
MEKSAKKPAKKTARTNDTLHAWLAVPLTIIFFAAGQFAGVLLVSLIAGSIGQTKDWVLHAISAHFIEMLLAEVISVGLVVWFVRWRKIGLKNIGLVKPKAQDALYALAGYAVYFVAAAILSVILSSIAPSLSGGQQQTGFQNAHTAVQLVLSFLILVIIVPPAEEILFRGFLFSNLRRKLSFWLAALLTSIVFAAGHLPESAAGHPPLYLLGLITFVMSLVMCVLREKTGRLSPSIGMHMVVNFIAFVAIFAVQ